jgi:hypothetical protein
MPLTLAIISATWGFIGGLIFSTAMLLPLASSLSVGVFAVTVWLGADLGTATLYVVCALGVATPTFGLTAAIILSIDGNIRRTEARNRRLARRSLLRPGARRNP